MSGFEKHGVNDMNVYDVRRPSQSFTTINDFNEGRTSSDGSSYLYSQNGLQESPAQAASNEVMYGAHGLTQPRASFDSGRSGFDEYGARKLPEVKSYNPPRGCQGSHVYIFLRAEYDLLASPSLNFSLIFAKKAVRATIARLESQGPAFEFCITADAPNFSETESATTQIQLRLRLEEQSGQAAGLVDVGYFQYTSNMQVSSQQDVSRKRKLSMSQDDYRLTSNNFGYDQGLGSPYGRAQSRYADAATRRGMLMSSAGSRSFIHPQQANYGSSLYFNGAGGRNLALDGFSTTTLDSTNPTLIRTSTLQQSNPSSSAGGNASFNPYTMYPQKAVLKLRGNLNSMTENWTPEEWTAKRRLVQFRRSQNKSTINAEFAPVKPEDRQPNSICISCIWWEERQECFATSVDTIYLLEQLVALRFTVEEKNRIRRNLEGFKPQTVAKGRPDSEEFFKVIMGFPNPKPRNIEKDVKVFEWKILAGALKKIMSKYSASYSSTAGVLPQSMPQTHGYGYGRDPGAGADGFNYTTSRSTSGSTASSGAAVAHTLKSNTLSPSDTAHTIPSQYSDSGPLTGNSLVTMGPQTPSYVSPRLPMGQYAHQSPLPQLSHAYTMPISRSRSSQGPSIGDSDPDYPRYAKRPRANTATTIAPTYTTTPSPALHGTDTGAMNVPPTPNSAVSNGRSHDFTNTVTTPGQLHHPPTPSSYGPGSGRSYSDSQGDLMRGGTGMSSMLNMGGGMPGDAF